MSLTSPPRSRPSLRVLRLPLAALAVMSTLALSACFGGGGSTAKDVRTSSASVIEDVEYGEVDGDPLLLNACLPPISSGDTPAVILIHGGGFETGNKDSEGMQSLCTTIADNGVAAFNIDYRLAPRYSYPAQVDDLTTAIRWLREDDQAVTYGIDPARLALFGSSAGAIMAASAGTAGDGPLTEGDRVAAVVALSPAVDFTENGFSLGTPSEQEIQLILQYLGCTDVADCPDAEAASPLYSVDPSDPPFYIAISENEIVPVQQGQAFAAALGDAGVDVTLDVKPGSKHAIQLLDNDTRLGILAFLQQTLDIGN